MFEQLSAKIIQEVGKCSQALSGAAQEATPAGVGPDRPVTKIA